MYVMRRSAVLLASSALVAALLVAGGVWRYHTTRPNYRLRHGQEALLRGDMPRAERMAELLESSGYTDHAHLLRGQVYLHRHRLNQAILEYNQIRHEQEDILAEASLIYGLGFLSLGEYVRAERLLLDVAEVRPDNVDAHRGLAVIYNDRGATHEALHHLRKWSELDDRDGWPHRCMALVYQDVGADGPAVEQYRAALCRDLAPETRAKAVVELAEVLLKQRQYAEALACLDDQFQGSVATGIAAELRAECLHGLGRGPEALRELEQARGAAAPSPRWLRVRANIHADAGEVRAAVELLETALQAEPHDFECRYQLAQAYDRLDRHAEAAEQRRLLENSLQLLRELGDLNREAIEKPRDARIRKRLAELCQKLGKHDLAQMWLRAARLCPAENPTR